MTDDNTNQSTTPPPPPPPADPTGQIPAPPAASGGGLNVSVDNPVSLALGVIAVVGIVLGLLLRSEGIKLWDTMGWTWAVLAIVAAVVVLALSLGGLVPVSRAVAGQAMLVSAGILVLWWVLFILPYVQLNSAFLATAGTLAAVGAAYLGRDTTS